MLGSSQSTPTGATRQGSSRLGLPKAMKSWRRSGRSGSWGGAGIVKFVLLIKVTEMARPSKPKNDLPSNWIDLDPEQWYDAHEDTND